ncbi:unnamed protein product [Dovyalis caffra]|uniref:Uncharacterized protein n=1 Tax=Dovyalis caffra TaxID=77055 RepID=A0AAV1SJU4_9ROSI|nr:unnamed protein product [Dovyalis caffra]
MASENRVSNANLNELIVGSENAKLSGKGAGQKIQTRSQQNRNSASTATTQMSIRDVLSSSGICDSLIYKHVDGRGQHSISGITALKSSHRGPSLKDSSSKFCGTQSKICGTKIKPYITNFEAKYMLSFTIIRLLKNSKEQEKGDGGSNPFESWPVSGLCKGEVMPRSSLIYNQLLGEMKGNQPNTRFRQSIIRRVKTCYAFDEFPNQENEENLRGIEFLRLMEHHGIHVNCDSDNAVKVFDDGIKTPMMMKVSSVFGNMDTMTHAHEAADNARNTYEIGPALTNVISVLLRKTD